jgi:glyoxylase-like metal-dependent hydrolase (beta-lactamase superfamily II)
MSYIHKITNELFNSNTYLYIVDGKCIVIDPGSDYYKIKSYIISRKLSILFILATHGHFDHVSSASLLKKEFDCKFYMHRNDFKILKMANFLMKMFGYNNKIEVPLVDNYLEGDEGSIKFLGINIVFFLFPGHTSGSCVFKIENNLFTGDTLFYSTDISKIPNDNIHLLRLSQKCIFEKFDDNFFFWPGHGNGGPLKEIKNFLIKKL